MKRPRKQPGAARIRRPGVAPRGAPGFDAVTYSDWDALLVRLWTEAPAGSALALDDFPALVGSEPELPSLLQKRLDRQPGRWLLLVLAGSPQRIMHGLVLPDGSVRAEEDRGQGAVGLSSPEGRRILTQPSRRLT